MREEIIPLLDMEEALAADADGGYLRSLREFFRCQASELSRYMDQGLPEAEFRKHEELRKSMELADTLVEKVWRFMHRPPA